MITGDRARDNPSTLDNTIRFSSRHKSHRVLNAGGRQTFIEIEQIESFSVTRQIRRDRPRRPVNYANSWPISWIVRREKERKRERKKEREREREGEGESEARIDANYS